MWPSVCCISSSHEHQGSLAWCSSEWPHGSLRFHAPAKASLPSSEKSVFDSLTLTLSPSVAKYKSPMMLFKLPRWTTLRPGSRSEPLTVLHATQCSALLSVSHYDHDIYGKTRWHNEGGSQTDGTKSGLVLFISSVTSVIHWFLGYLLGLLNHSPSTYHPVLHPIKWIIATF